MKKYPPRPHARSPQLWMGYYYGARHDVGDKFRILYPGGKSEWVTAGWLSLNGRFFDSTPCWQAWSNFEKSKEIVRIMPSFKKRIALMKKYDARFKRKTIFLGNI